MFEYWQFGGLIGLLILLLCFTPFAIMGYMGRNLKVLSLVFIALGLGLTGPNTAILVAGFGAYHYALTFLAQKSRNQAYVALFFAVIPLLLLRLILPAQHAPITADLIFAFITLRSIQVIIDIADRRIIRIKWDDYIGFLLFLPTLLSGPLDRYSRFVGDFNYVNSSQSYVMLLQNGLMQVINGAFYVFFIAALLAEFLFPRIESIDSEALKMVAYFYVWPIYYFFSFAGISLIAIGLASICGVQTPQNFHLPFFATNIKEFWSRWHITLYNWLHDYVSTRLRSYIMANRPFIGRQRIVMLCNMSLFIAMGLFHGFNLHCLMFGVYMGLAFTIYEHLSAKYPFYKFVSDPKGNEIVCMVVNYHVVALGFLFLSGKLIAF